MTIGVLNRVEELADREENFKPKNAKPFRSLIPLSEILSKVIGYGVATQKTWKEFNNLIKNFHTEFNVLLEASSEDLTKVTDDKIADAIIKIRDNDFEVKPGYDGVYGELILEQSEIIKKKQKNLSDFS